MLPQFQFITVEQVLITCDAKAQQNLLPMAPSFPQVIQDRENGGEAGTTGYHDQGGGLVAQEKFAERPFDLDIVAGLSML